MYDVVIVGTGEHQPSKTSRRQRLTDYGDSAGLYGIQAARYYLDVHPDAKLLLLEADDVVGGTWSSKRMYADFYTQTPVKMAEFSDRPMTPPPAEEQYYGFFPGRHTTAYLEAYVDNHSYAGRTIRDRIRFNSPVDSVVRTLDHPNTAEDGSRNNAQWTITHSTNIEIQTAKLIDATGMTSQAQTPNLPGASAFRGKTLHHKSFGQEQRLLLQDPSVRNICIVGGAKSAADVAYACAKASVVGVTKREIHWVIREDGNGPSAFFAAPAMSPRYANSNEGFYNRLLAAFLPNRFGGAAEWGSWLKWLLQGTALGRWWVKRLWDGFDKGLRGFHDYQREEGREMGFKNLEYDVPIFWQNDSSGVANHPDFLSTIARNVHVHRRNISHLSEDSITLQPRSDGSSGAEKPLTVPVDVLVYCTGWSAKSTLFPSHEAGELGLSVPLKDADPQTQARWQELEKAADPVILARFPMLKHPPAYRKLEPRETPFRLYKAIAPPADDSHSIVFLGKMVVGNNFRTAEAQALWAVAYLDGRIRDVPARMQREQEVAETVAWDRRRYLNKGELGSWFYYDVVDYADMLFEQLGLSSHRQKGFMGNLMEPCFAADLKGIGDEYKRKHRI
ncbi:MAG: hypothetical protein Q9206_003903 [Seirophora lacunosa]